MNKIIAKILREASYQTGKYFLPPEFLSLIITENCNFRCQSCSIWQKTAAEELSEEDWKKIISGLPAVLGKNAFVEINGGEPLLKKNLVFSLIKELKKYFKKITLNSNGSLLGEESARQLKEAGLDTIKISFYSLNEKTHNFLRGEQSAFSNAKKAIEAVIRSGIKLEIGLLLAAQNIKEAPALIEYLQKLPNTAIILQPLDEKIESKDAKNPEINNLPANLWPKKEDADIFFSWVVKNKAKIKNSLANIEAMRQYYLNPEKILKYRCFSGQRNLVIYPNGDASFCFKRGVIGNLNKQPLKQILKNSGQERKKIKYCRKYCRIIGCNFSRGLKEAFWGKFLNLWT